MQAQRTGHGPYIVTTKRPCPACTHGPAAGGEHRPESMSRRAAATLEERIVFNADEWKAAGYDQPDGNLQFWHHALILGQRTHECRDREEETSAEILWLHTGEVSRGHLLWAMGKPGEITRRLPPFPTRWPERLIPESGSSVGPLPDGTVIEVEPIGAIDLFHAAGLPKGPPYKMVAEVIAAYNAAQAEGLMT